jgi:hypothetical protein
MRATEFEIQAFLYCGLRSLGYNVRGELQYDVPGMLKKAKFDLCLLDAQGVLLWIIEVKRRDFQGSFEKTKQYTKYKAFGVPLTYIFGMEDADRFISEAKRKGSLPVM